MAVELLLGLDEEVVASKSSLRRNSNRPPWNSLLPIGGGVEHAPGLAELGGVGALLHLELLQRVERGLDVGPALMVVGHVHAVDQERELAAAHAADGGPEMKLARMRTRLPPPGSPAAPGVRRASS